MCLCNKFTKNIRKFDSQDSNMYKALLTKL